MFSIFGMTKQGKTDKTIWGRKSLRAKTTDMRNGLSKCIQHRNRKESIIRGEGYHIAGQLKSGQIGS